MKKVMLFFVVVLALFASCQKRHDLVAPVVDQTPATWYVADVWYHIPYCTHPAPEIGTYVVRYVNEDGNILRDTLTDERFVKHFAKWNTKYKLYLEIVEQITPGVPQVVAIQYTDTAGIVEHIYTNCGSLPDSSLVVEKTFYP